MSDIIAYHNEQEENAAPPNTQLDKWKQVIVVRKDLGMSPGKLAAQVSHASMAFLTRIIHQNVEKHPNGTVSAVLLFDEDMYEGWLGGIFTKVCLGAKNKNKLMHVIDDARVAGMQEGRDFFIIRDHCLAELEPEEIDENGEGWTVTCIGFRPMRSSEINPITRKLQLLR